MEKVRPGAAKLFNANTTKEEGSAIMAAMLDKKSNLKLLYVTPEKLAKSKRFMSKLQVIRNNAAPSEPKLVTRRDIDLTSSI